MANAQTLRHTNIKQIRTVIIVLSGQSGCTLIIHCCALIDGPQGREHFNSLKYYTHRQTTNNECWLNIHAYTGIRVQTNLERKCFGLSALSTAPNPARPSTG